MKRLILVGLCINPETKRPYPVSIIEKGLKDVHFSVKQGRSSKQQALEGIQLLKTVIPIERAQMRVRISATGMQGKTVLEKIGGLGLVEEKDFSSGGLNLVRFWKTLWGERFLIYFFCILGNINGPWELQRN